MRRFIPRGVDRTTLLLAGITAAAFLVSLAVLIASWSKPILDMHGFRQTQTAESVLVLTQGGPLLAYETPVLGYPWTIPFEFPLFQWIVAGIHVLTGLSIEPAGRAVSWLFFAGTLVLTDRLIRRLGGDRSLSLILCSILLVSPVYLFWSRAFLIESIALFFSVLFLLGLIGYLQRGGPRFLASLVAGGLLAALIKITTFATFIPAAGVITLANAFATFRRDRSLKKAVRTAVVPSLATALVMGVTGAWLVYSLELRASNPLGVQLNSRLTGWNFGSLEQRLNINVWTEVIFGRGLKDTFGWAPLLWVAILGLVILKKDRRLAAVLFGLYLAPYLIFTNVHIVHNYYQYANAAFASAILALLVWNFVKAQKTPVAIALLIIAMALSLYRFSQGFWPSTVSDTTQARTLAVVRHLREATNPEQVIVVFGYGWSPEISFYSERRSITVPDWIDPALVTPDKAAVLAGERSIGAVVDCRDMFQPLSGKFSDVVQALAAGRILTEVDDCHIYR